MEVPNRMHTASDIDMVCFNWSTKVTLLSGIYMDALNLESLPLKIELLITKRSLLGG